MSLIYLDNAATTFPKPAYVIDAVNDCISNFAFNPHRGYNTLVGKANFQLEQTRNLLAENLKLNSAKQVIFVPSATHGINLVIQGFLCRLMILFIFRRLNITPLYDVSNS